MTIKIILVDDHKLMREGLRALIENEPNMAVIAEFLPVRFETCQEDSFMTVQVTQPTPHRGA